MILSNESVNDYKTTGITPARRSDFGIGTYAISIAISIAMTIAMTMAMAMAMTIAMAIRIGISVRVRIN